MDDNGTGRNRPLNLVMTQPWRLITSLVARLHGGREIWWKDDDGGGERSQVH